MVMRVEVTNIYCKFIDKLTSDQLGVIQTMCSFKVENSDFKANAFRNRGHGHKGFEWDGYKKLFNVQTKKFPIGLLSFVRDTLMGYGIIIEVIDMRTYTDTKEYINTNLLNTVEMRDYQKYAVQSSMINGSGIIKVATGGGKTVIAAGTIYMMCKHRSVVFIVHTRDLLYQAKRSFERILGCEIGQIGDGIIDYKQITVATMQTLAILGSMEIEPYKYDEENDTSNEIKIEATKQRISDFYIYKNKVSCVMMDEVQIVSSKMAFGVRFLFENANNAFGYSASPWRDDGSDLMIEAAFGKRIVDISASELISMGYLVRPIISIIKNTTSVYSGDTYPEIYKSAIVENVFRNQMVIERALMHYNLGRNTLILVTMIKHGEILEKMIKSMGINVQFISGKSGMKKRTKAIQDMRDGNIQLLIASTIADVGLDIPRLQSLVEAGAGKSSVTALQRIGRIMRPFENKDLCYFDTFNDDVPMIREHIHRKIEIWNTERKFIIEEV